MKDIYLVHYHEDNGLSKKYEIKMENCGKIIRTPLLILEDRLLLKYNCLY